ncbi:NADH-quinone oxidoreductase subunit B family protein [Chromobacterium paludis]|uniref:NADP oxidoreductase n=1 Tax=Chromobacterium paludis TaxID=2605945 RepID=A0A5C1DEC8_9NEIS|nr:NADP oxidoreductase [Chromobacterium paludis]QEL55125.1 NADP oxidoreductase [Chromobacterium paludis]
MARKLTVATCSLAGCFGCHMSLLDIDERLAALTERVAFDRSPLTDIKRVSDGVDLGLIEGGVCNEENVETLREFRRQCRVLVAVGACALTGGVPALRNRFSAEACLAEAYGGGATLAAPLRPGDPELPRLLDKVYPVHELVAVDYCLPGCPPPADAFWELLTALLDGREPRLDYALRRFD